MPHSYPVPAQPVSVCEEIKKSRFITLLAHTPGVDAAKAFVQETRRAHPDARHHCWAFVAGAPGDTQRLGFSDDGEPSGTAGKPMLAQLMGSGVGEVCAVVVRYYGGIKLGTGGLVRAYGSGVQQALQALVRRQKVPMAAYTLCCDYAQLTLVEGIVAQAGGSVLDSAFSAQVMLRLSLPLGSQDEVGEKLRNASRGALQLQATS
ncbi:IMPACT family protein [Edwardsiella piscicida]|uniref:IMPACT family protein n=1 Tax=Edwardsiella piscicida TaxID=1263550 RepID=UPI00084BE935|nr:IMPACT family protein [Edwardsiella piscicida]AOP41676.1 IMPACT family protein [Edwardsiella piscicida]EKS7767434.1 IMPACT family protein [Edwardsiella piscicida]EKS7793256.1 IMPACT family protein [Edwardsiella piscicida]EKS7813677.1 IMPACT family protein [Edwardsiella piscicida]ELM3728347.1 IMPACT family protein [Edwardsiella piscicida]